MSQNFDTIMEREGRQRELQKKTNFCTHFSKITNNKLTISAINVDTPFCTASPAPTLARIQSVTERVALSQGTKQPTCASTVMQPTARMYVLLPP